MVPPTVSWPTPLLNGARLATFLKVAMATDTPALRQQYDDWREQRAQNGKDSTDDQSFRQHFLNMGATGSRRARAVATNDQATFPSAAWFGAECAASVRIRQCWSCRAMPSIAVACRTVVIVPLTSNLRRAEDPDNVLISSVSRA
jgi:hypothetical protein